MIRTAWWFTLFLTFSCFGALAVLILLHHQHYSYDPYSWFNVTEDKVLVRDLWNAQKDLYRWFIVRVSILTSVFSVITVVLTFLQRKSNRNLQ
jgi:hypothetical protein